MPILLTNNHTCERCEKEFEWNYFKLTRQYIDSTHFTVESIPDGKTLVHNCQQISNGIYEIEVNCPYCDYDNHFTFNAKQ